jgi:hypothetical protein
MPGDAATRERGLGWLLAPLALPGVAASAAAGWATREGAAAALWPALFALLLPHPRHWSQAGSGPGSARWRPSPTG